MNFLKVPLSTLLGVSHCAIEFVQKVHLTRQGIERMSQNKPKYIANDFEWLGIPRDVTYRILLARGVFKWLAARRDLIKLKERLKGQVRDTQKDMLNLKQLGKFHRRMAERLKDDWMYAATHVGGEEANKIGAQIREHRKQGIKTSARRQYLRGYLRGLEEARAEIRTITHSPRWRAPDNDVEAQRWLEAQEV